MSIPFIDKTSVEIVELCDSLEIMRHLEKIGRSCYKSEDKITDGSFAKFLQGIIDRGHEAMLEHYSVTLLFHVDRGVSHEIVRHRHCAFAQTSTRYCDYSKEKFGKAIHVIQPFYFNIDEERVWTDLPLLGTHQQYRSMNSFDVWFTACTCANWAYQTLLEKFGRKPEEARSVLPNSLATDIYVTANFREWRHILKLRAVGTSGKPHPDMQAIMIKALEQLHGKFPVIFQDIMLQYLSKNGGEAMQNG